MWPKELVIVTGKKKDEQAPYGDINDGDNRTSNSKNQLCQILATAGVYFGH